MADNALANPIPSGAAAHDDDEDLDLISLLPDCIRATILSLLPLPAAGRTQILSHRWRRLWPSAPLHLLDSHLPVPTPSLCAAMCPCPGSSPPTASAL